MVLQIWREGNLVVNGIMNLMVLATLLTTASTIDSTVQCNIEETILFYLLDLEPTNA